jgi:hypothetical protein
LILTAVSTFCRPFLLCSRPLHQLWCQ